MQLHAVVETGWIIQSQPPWSFRAPEGWSWLRIAGMSEADLGYVVAVLAEYNEIPFGESPEDSLAAIAAHEDDVVLPGGVEVVDGDRAIHPGCCSGLEEWFEWGDVRDGGATPFLGHDPGPWMEVTDEGVRVWSDDREKTEVFSVFAPWKAYETAAASLGPELQEFVRALERWAGNVAPQNAARFVEKIRRSLRVPLYGE